MNVEQMATIGLDIAKAVFQPHGVGKSGSVVVQRRLRRWLAPTMLAQYSEAKERPPRRLSGAGK